MTTTIKTTTRPELLVADLDGTLLHDAEVFEDRFITQRSIDTIARAHDAGMKFAIATARPVSTGLQFAEKLPVDAVIYLNGALIDFDPANSDFDMLTSDSSQQRENHLIKIGFSSQRACEVCLFLLDRMPNLKIGIVMNDVRYTNFDVRVYSAGLRHLHQRRRDVDAHESSGQQGACAALAVRSSRCPA